MHHEQTHRPCPVLRKLVEIGQFAAELILHQCMHVENLRRVVQAIGQINTKAHDESLSEVQAIIQAMVNG